MRYSKQIGILMLVLTILLLNLAFVNAFQLLTAKMIIREDIKPGQVTEITKPIGVLNDENNTATVNFDVLGDIIGMVELDEKNITLKSGEERWVNFTLTISQAGNYNGDIVALFTEEGEGKTAKSVGLSYQLIILVNEAQMNETSVIGDNTQSLSPGYLILGILLVAVVATVFIIKKKK